MRVIRHILIVCLALGLIANGLQPAHAMPCASAPHGGTVPAPVHHHADASHSATGHHQLIAVHGDRAQVASQDRAVDYSDRDARLKPCDCGCFSLCGAMGAALPRAEALERHAIDITYAVIAQAAPDGIQFVDPGIPILAA
jgi:hypothetical protein